MNTWLGAAGALDDSPRLFRMVQAFGGTAGTDELAVATSLLCQAWAVGVPRPAIAGLVGARRVADLGAANTELAFDEEGRPVAASPATPRYAALAGDLEAAADQWAEIVDDDDALVAWARSRLFDGHLAALVDALADIAPVGRRLLWGNVAAATAGAFAAAAGAELPTAARAALMLRDARRPRHRPPRRAPPLPLRPPHPRGRTPPPHHPQAGRLSGLLTPARNTRRGWGWLRKSWWEIDQP